MREKLMTEREMTHKQLLEYLVMLANAIQEKQYVKAQRLTEDLTRLLDHISRL